MLSGNREPLLSGTNLLAQRPFGVWGRAIAYFLRHLQPLLQSIGQCAWSISRKDLWVAILLPPPQR